MSFTSAAKTGVRDEKLFYAAGARVLFEGNDLQRAYRDLQRRHRSGAGVGCGH